MLFTLGDKSFVSEKLDWMAIHGRKAWVRGQGQLNGVGGYEFLLAVVDDRTEPERPGPGEDLEGQRQDGDRGLRLAARLRPLDALAVTPMKTGKITIPLFKGKSWKYYLMQKK